MAKVYLKVFRYDPSLDEEPYYSMYEVPFKEWMTLLEALHYINDNIEQITFDASCKASLCGRCGMMINGEPVLACYKTLQEEQAYTIEPLKGFPVIRDLTIDRTMMRKQLEMTNLEVQTTKSFNRDKAPVIDYNYMWGTLERLNMCRECGNCLAVCPVYAKDKENYQGPAALAQIALRANDRLDESNRVLQAVVSGVFRCIECGSCSKVCPSYIDHPKLFRELKERAIEKDLVPAEEGLQLLMRNEQKGGQLF